MPIAIWTTRTATVTTKPVNAADAPTIVDNIVVAIDGEYCQNAGGVTASSSNTSSGATIAPTMPPITGHTHRLDLRYWRRLNFPLQVIVGCLRSSGPWFGSLAAPLRGPVIPTG